MATESAQEKRSSLLLAVLAFVMLCLAYSSSWKDSPTHDEPEHVMAGYAYLKYSDFRFNAFHPPLVKDIAAFPLLFLDLKFPHGSEAWENGYYVKAGQEFFFELGNDAYLLTRVSRFVLLLFTAISFFLVSCWIKKRFGFSVAFFFLCLCALQPTILGHARYVTTDVPAALGLFLGTISIIFLLETSTARHFLLATALFSIAQLTKFSVGILFPLSYLLLFIYWLLRRSLQNGAPGAPTSSFPSLLIRVIAFHALTLLIISAVYTLHTLNFPAAYQLSYMQAAAPILPEFLQEAYLEAGRHDWLRPFVWYLTGILRVSHYTATGGPLIAYLAGSTYQGGNIAFFPSLVLFKETVDTFAFIILGILGAFAIRKRNMIVQASRIPAANRFVVYSFLLTFLSYWCVALWAGLNIGVRHIIPTLPIFYFLLALGVSRWLHPLPEQRLVISSPKVAILAVLLVSRLFITLQAWPHYLSYYNPLAGGVQKGHEWSVVSDYDWGQDLIRLKDLLDERGIKRVHLAYSNTADPKYYLGEKFVHWWPSNPKPKAGEYFALSITLLHIPQYAGLQSLSETNWIYGLEPVGIAGTSLVLFQMPMPHSS